MANGQDVSNNQPLTDAQRDAFIARMKTAWANLPDDKQAALKPLLDDALRIPMKVISIPG
ncbi:MAG: hypothetical protein WCE53_07640 [Candidatus Acidiferrum sp.]